MCAFPFAAPGLCFGSLSGWSTYDMRDLAVKGTVAGQIFTFSISGVIDAAGPCQAIVAVGRFGLNKATNTG